MINGIDGFNEKFEMKDRDWLVHKKETSGPDSNVASSDRDASVILYSMIEQVIGQEVYTTLGTLGSACDTYVREIEAYRDAFDKHKMADVEYNNLVAQRKKLEVELETLAEAIQKATAKKETIAVLSPQYEMTRANLEKVIADLLELDKQRDSTALDRTAADKALHELQQSRQAAKDQDMDRVAKEAIAKLLAEKETIIQGYVDATLLVDEQGREPQIRQAAETMIRLAVMELEGLAKGMVAADELVAYGTKDKDYTAPIPDKTSSRLKIMDKLHYIAELIYDSPYDMLTNPKFTAFVGSAIDMRTRGENITTQSMFDMGRGLGIAANYYTAPRKKAFGLIPYGQPIEIHLESPTYSKVMDLFADLSTAELEESKEPQEHGAKFNKKASIAKKAGTKDTIIAASVIAANTGRVPTLNPEDKMPVPASISADTLVTPQPSLSGTGKTVGKQKTDATAYTIVGLDGKPLGGMDNDGGRDL